MIALVFKDFESLRQPIPESPSGRAWFVLDGVSFPGEDWFDFPLSMLGSAFDAYLELMRGAPEAVSYVFDGPFNLNYQRSASVSEASVKISAYSEDDEVGQSLKAETEVPLPELRSALMESAELMAVALSSVEGADGVNSRIVARILGELERHGSEG
ncbi:hypothetical protein [Verrucosispora sioxanthis]|uniref:Uncharacterized protein n=1 Tax=Verrucosispora sioxanthis TaxID=2499994 RepID=A0A6M1L9S1_9ACTN|nr:hypothetical protein [Verrucosispora sioxanthis]NEE65928.1 hypothetical protein [Verrucosispora sioxanthis]NGM15038.1 hypothetical protein [Verrucosispora sioxanthis]